MDLRSWKSVACVVVGMATGCAGGRATTIPDAAPTRAAQAAEAPDEKPTAETELPITEAAVPSPAIAEPPENAGPVATPQGLPEPVVLPPEDPAPSPGEQRTYSAEVCPVGIPGLAVHAASARGGAELVFTADPMHRRALRERVARFVELHREARRAHAGETTAPPATFGDEDAQIHHAEVRAVPTAEGVRLVARADRPADTASLREELEEDASALQRGACPLALEIVG